MAQKREKLQKRKTEDRKMISLDALKQLGTPPFEPVSPDRAEEESPLRTQYSRRGTRR